MSRGYLSAFLALLPAFIFRHSQRTFRFRRPVLGKSATRQR